MQNRAHIQGQEAAKLSLGLVAIAIAIGVVAWIAASPAQPAGPDALWHIVHDLCVIDMKANGLPAPCTAVNLSQGYAVLKDIRGQTQLLVIPTSRVTGIEDPKILEPTSPNYWQAAWETRPLFEKRIGRPVPREDIGLAINSFYGRSQNQLHIHIDCVRPDVQSALQANQAAIGPMWSDLNPDLAGRHYRVMRIEGADIGSRNLFKLLADGDPRARTDMGRETLVAIGATFRDGKPGFVLVSGRADLTTANVGHGEDLLDHDCKVLSQSAGDGAR
jgi:CDP-diacylglycerol pyrophosphatase